MVDVDDTLILWDTSKYPDLKEVEVSINDLTATVRINEKNVNLVKKLAKLDYTIVVWSQTGYDWAEAVSNAVGLSQYVSLYLTKPRYYVDDKECQKWMGERLWRDPTTGESE